MTAKPQKPLSLITPNNSGLIQNATGSSLIRSPLTADSSRTHESVTAFQRPHDPALLTPTSLSSNSDSNISINQTKQESRFASYVSSKQASSSSNSWVQASEFLPSGTTAKLNTCTDNEFRVKPLAPVSSSAQPYSSVNVQQIWEPATTNQHHDQVGQSPAPSSMPYLPARPLGDNGNQSMYTTNQAKFSASSISTMNIDLGRDVKPFFPHTAHQERQSIPETHYDTTARPDNDDLYLDPWRSAYTTNLHQGFGHGDYYNHPEYIQSTNQNTYDYFSSNTSRQPFTPTQHNGVTDFYENNPLSHYSHPTEQIYSNVDCQSTGYDYKTQGGPVRGYGYVPTGFYHNHSLSNQRDISRHIVRSSILEDFHNNGKVKRFELSDISGHIAEFSGDQAGSRFIQGKLESANPGDRQQFFLEVLPNARQLMTDVFGNYVIQKMFQHGSMDQRRELAGQMSGHMFALSTHAFGCRVIQTALEFILVSQKASLFKELEGRVLQVVEDMNGNHVIQKAIEELPSEHVRFIVDAHLGHVYNLSRHPYGCRVVQRMLEHCDPIAKRQLLDELHKNISGLIQDAFGNYVVQHIIATCDVEDKRPVIDKVCRNLFENAQHKFASNVVEKALDFAEDHQRAMMLRILTIPGARSQTKGDVGDQSPVMQLLGHNFGNYVIREWLPCVMACY